MRDEFVNGDMVDELHKHFERKSTELRHWMEVGDEGRRIYRLLAGLELEEVEVDHAAFIDSLLDAIAAAADHAALWRVAGVLLLDPEAFSSAINAMHDDGRGEGWTAMMSNYEEEVRRLADRARCDLPE